MIYIANESDKNSLNERIDTTESKQSLWFNFAISALKDMSPHWLTAYL